MEYSRSTVAPVSRRSGLEVAKLALLSVVGTSIEWYDFFLYGLGAALVFPSLFFPPALPHSAALIASFLTFAAGFVARPLGAVVFGYLGDQLGRKHALAMALVLMGAATTLIACLPAYREVGVIAPIALVLLRLLQGIAVGGQWGGAVLLVLESAPGRKRGFFGSLPQIGAPVGTVIANLAFVLVGDLASPEAFINWAWRLPFFASVVLIGVGLYVHYHIEETPLYQQFSQQRRATIAETRVPALQVVRDFRQELTLAALAQFAVNVCFYVNVTYAVAYATQSSGPDIPRTTMLTAVLVASVMLIPMVLGFGVLSDRVGRRRLYMTGAALSAAASFLLFPAIETRSIVWIMLGCLLVSVPVAMMYAPQGALFGELFPTRVRYSGASLAYQLGAILGGGLAPLIATLLMTTFRTTVAVSLYMAGACLIGLLAVKAMRETAGVRLDD